MPARIANREAILATVIERVAAGEYVEDICAEEGMPHRVTVQRWLDEDEDAASQWARARARSAVVEERRVAALAAKVEAGELAPEAARVAINARQWLAKIRDPRSYGDKLDVEHRGTIKVQPVVEVVIAGPAPRIIEGDAQRE